MPEITDLADASEGPAARARHVAWAKERARRYFVQGDYQSAAMSLLSDLGKRDDTRVNPSLVMLAMFYLRDADHEGLAAWIEGFR